MVIRVQKNARSANHRPFSHISQFVGIYKSPSCSWNWHFAPNIARTLHILFLKIFIICHYNLYQIDFQQLVHDTCLQGIYHPITLILFASWVVLYHGFINVCTIPCVSAVLPWCFCKSPTYFARFPLSFTSQMQGVFAKAQGVYITISRQSRDTAALGRRRRKRQMTNIF